MVTLLVWPWFGKVEALLREKKCGIRMWDPKENGDRERERERQEKLAFSGLFCLSLFSLKTTLLKAKSGLGL